MIGHYRVTAKLPESRMSKAYRAILIPQPPAAVLSSTRKVAALRSSLSGLAVTRDLAIYSQ
jgi:hypothetical protein